MMSEFLNKTIYSNEKIISLISVIVILYIIYLFVAIAVKKVLSHSSRSKKQKANIVVFIHLIKYIFYIIGFLSIIFVLTGSLTGLGISAGLLSAAMGWALQRPITGVAAWFMVIVKKPFQIGDRILIGDTKGDVIEISLTHISLGEIGGTIASEEISGRVILIPNSILFEQKVINYTMQDEFILDEAATLISYESDLEHAKKICYDAADKFLEKELKDKKEKPIVRIFQHESGVHIKVRYKVRTSNRIEILSNINNEIITNISKTRDVNIAYPHVHIISKDKTVKGW